VVGLESTPVPFAFAAAPITAIAIFYAASSGRPYASPGRILSTITAALGTAVMVASASRSGVAGLILSVAVGLWISGRVLFRRLLLIGIPLGLVVWFAGPTLLEWLSKEQDTTQDIRLRGTWMTYLPVVITHPAGVPDSTYWSDAVDHAHAFLGLSVDSGLVDESLQIAPHNAFLTMGVCYGWIGLLALIAVYVYAWRQAKGALAKEQTSSEVRLFASGLLCGMAAVLVHMWFHNASIFMGEMRNWLIIGLMAGCPYLVNRDENARAASSDWNATEKQA
jgi:hypothetical protein